MRQKWDYCCRTDHLRKKTAQCVHSEKQVFGETLLLKVPSDLFFASVLTYCDYCLLVLCVTFLSHCSGLSAVVIKVKHYCHYYYYYYYYYFKFFLYPR